MDKDFYFLLSITICIFFYSLYTRQDLALQLALSFCHPSFTLLLLSFSFFPLILFPFFSVTSARTTSSVGDLRLDDTLSDEQFLETAVGMHFFHDVTAADDGFANFA